MIRKIEFISKNLMALTAAISLTFLSFTTVHGQLFLGTTSWGASAHGSVFLYNAGTNTFTNVANLSPGTGLGYYPEGSFIKASNGKFYAMMSGGDVSGSVGTVVEYDILTGVLTKKTDFDTGFNGTGASPYGSFVEGMKDKLYAMTPMGAANNHGSIVEYDIATNTLTKKVDLDSVRGWTGYGTLIKASNGKLYGLTSDGGTYNKGTIIEYDMVLNTLTKKADFDSSNGQNPHGAFMEASNGKLYAMTQTSIIEYDVATNTLLKKASLNIFTGVTAYGDLVEGIPGKLFGITFAGGNSNWMGTVVEFDFINDTLTKITNLDGITGGHPYGSFIKASDGKLYGMTSTGGSYNGGTIVSYDPISNIFTKEADFDGVAGSSPGLGKFLEIDTTTGVSSTDLANNNVAVSVADGKVVNLNFINMRPGEYAIGLYNILGQTVFTTKIHHAGGTVLHKLNAQDVLKTKGIYVISVSNESSCLTKAILSE
jgi:uncharacterized repeat protein (TIGR03803 family)